MEKTAILLGIMVTALVSCKSSYTRIGDENANYIPYYLKVYEADSLFIVGDYERSYEILDSLFKKYEPIEIQGYYEYSSYVFSAVLSGKNKNLKKLAKKGYINNGNLHTQQVAVLLKLDSINDVIGLGNKKIDKYKEIYNKNINWELRKKIDQMSEEDQAIRQGDNIDTNKLGVLASIHEKIIVDIFDEHGYPSTKKIGFGNGDLRAIFLHTDPVEYTPNYLLPKLKEYVIKGYEVPDVYGAVFNKWYYFENEEYYFTPNKENYNKKEMDSIRRAFGLPHLNYSNWKMKKMMEDIERFQRNHQ